MSHSEASRDIYAVATEAASSKAAALLALPISIAVSIGRVRVSIEELLAAAPQTVLTLDAKIDDPVELIVGDHVIARGRLVDLGDGGPVGVEITEIIAAGSER